MVALTKDLATLADFSDKGEARTETSATPGAAAAPGPGEDETLARYFGDVAAAGNPMTAAEEKHLAEELEAAQRLVWERILSYEPLAPRVRERARETLGTLPRARRSLAEKLADRDRDRDLLAVVLADAAEMGAGRRPPEGGRAAYAKFLRGVRQAQSLAETARHDFVRRNLRLVVAVARRYRNAGMSFGDLIQEGNLGLLKAVDRFDVHRGFRFSTYASWWIRHAIGRALSDRGRLVREPVYRTEARRKVAAAGRQLSAQSGRPATADELAEATGMPLASVERTMVSSFAKQLSLDQPRAEGHERTLAESIADPEAERSSAPELIARRQTHKALDKALSRLSPIEVTVLRKRYGLGSDTSAAPDGKTLAEIGREHRLSRERIRQIQEAALAKLRVAMAAET